MPQIYRFILFLPHFLLKTYKLYSSILKTQQERVFLSNFKCEHFSFLKFLVCTGNIIHAIEQSSNKVTLN